MIKLEQVRREVGQIVAEAPMGHRYKLPDENCKRCSNVRRNEVGRWVGDCLIGIWLLRFPAKDVPDLAETLGEGSARATGVVPTLTYLRNYQHIHVQISQLAVEWLAAVQEKQDAGVLWTACLSLTDEEFRDRNRQADTVLHDTSLLHS